MQKNSNIICDSYLNMTAASSHYQDNWICDETWFRLLNAHYPHLKNTFNFTREGLNRALSAKAGPFTGPNEFGVFSVKFRTECPYSGERRRVSYFYRQVMASLQQIQFVLWILLMSFQNPIRSACDSAEQPACDSAEE